MPPCQDPAPKKPDPKSPEDILVWPRLKITNNWGSDRCLSGPFIKTEVERKAIWDLLRSTQDSNKLPRASERAMSEWIYGLNSMFSTCGDDSKVYGAKYCVSWQPEENKEVVAALEGDSKSIKRLYTVRSSKMKSLALEGVGEDRILPFTVWGWGDREWVLESTVKTFLELEDAVKHTRSLIPKLDTDSCLDDYLDENLLPLDSYPPFGIQLNEPELQTQYKRNILSAMVTNQEGNLTWLAFITEVTFENGKWQHPQFMRTRVDRRKTLIWLNIKYFSEEKWIFKGPFALPSISEEISDLIYSLGKKNKVASTPEFINSCIETCTSSSDGFLPLVTKADIRYMCEPNQIVHEAIFANNSTPPASLHVLQYLKVKGDYSFIGRNLLLEDRIKPFILSGGELLGCPRKIKTFLSEKDAIKQARWVVKYYQDQREGTTLFDYLDEDRLPPNEAWPEPTDETSCSSQKIKRHALFALGMSENVLKWLVFVTKVERINGEWQHPTDMCENVSGTRG
ncbi:hypothetical protein GQ44DRAFT_766608 [Phaeosphaeriaceae sp. PMI808]|nr:hypothetical protein GQ44DRAFT_766608 [Phaeosphaeriaceae sp. PMI808]